MPNAARGTGTPMLANAPEMRYSPVESVSFEALPTLSPGAISMTPLTLNLQSEQSVTGTMEDLKIYETAMS